MNNFLNNLNGNAGLFQKALMSGLLGRLAETLQGTDGASEALLNAQNGAYLGASAKNSNGNGAYLAPYIQNFAQNNSAYKAPLTGTNPRHRCNLNLEEHQKYADALVLAGIIDENTGKSIKQKMAAVFHAENLPKADDGGDCADFNKCDFTKSEFLKARECLLEYLQNLDVELTSADLAKIEEVVLELEKQAISRNIKAPAGNSNPDNPYTSVIAANEAAKERLIGSALGTKGSKGLPQKAFTRDEIAKMSTAEFIKNEPQINYQLQNGLL